MEVTTVGYGLCISYLAFAHATYKLRAMSGLNLTSTSFLSMENNFPLDEKQLQQAISGSLQIVLVITINNNSLKQLSSLVGPKKTAVCCPSFFG